MRPDSDDEAHARFLEAEVVRRMIDAANANIGNSAGQRGAGHRRRPVLYVGLAFRQSA